ncbi:DEAD/DEAH box helicase [Brevibacillus halotolerans]|nr:DEAD/DEAH box helicase [Brevibacillus halotolerans]
MSNDFMQITRGPIVTFLRERGYEKLTPIQAQTLPAILEGKDVIAESPTGSGKTMAYLLPLVQNLDETKKELQVLVLAPTQELVMQIYREATQLLASIGMHAAALIGGVDAKRQLDKLKTHPAIVIGTPGRVKEMLEIRKLKVHTVKSVVIDEADRMLDHGFANPVQDVLRRLMRDTQRLFFSATLSKQTQALIKSMAHEPVVIATEAPESKYEVLHFYLVEEGRKKADALRRLIRLVNAKKTLVFLNTIERVDEIKEKLTYHHLECELLHRDTPKVDRARALQQFREGKLPVLIVTDVAARGIDISDVELVIHYDPATDADTYVHRSGRTGRMGKAGLVFSIVLPNQRFIIQKFSKQKQIPILEKAMSHGALVDPGEARNPNVGQKAKQRESSTGDRTQGKRSPSRKRF